VIAGDAAQAAYVRSLNRTQDRFLARIAATGANELGRVQRVLNAVFVKVDAAALETLAADPAVLRIAPVGDYELDLSETVPYTGAADVQANGVDGTGIKVAVLDSGIDYTHAALGGSGDPADYAANDPTVVEPGTFPTAKVVGGYDFVGSDWPNGPEVPDPDPIDDGTEAGHGTHVAHIIGGDVTDAANEIYPGVAPGVDLYAVKVCSSVSTACSGIALIQGMDFAVDPNMDGRAKDRVDVINMSLGSSYGQPFDDDLAAAVDGATALGVLTVASAGNSADKPYIVGTPSAAPTALSVAQTQVPSAALQLISVDGADYPAVFQPWSVPLTSVIGGPVQYGDGAGGNLNGCAPFAPGSLTGLIVLVDRGACNFTLKIGNISQAGGLAGIIGLVAPGAPFSGGDGGDRPIDIPGYMISQADSNAIKASLPAVGTIDPGNQLPLIGQMVGSSSRGPSNYYQAIKPEIGAPGASVSATAGTGTATGPFGGTSGAAPMVSGAAALVLDAFGGTKTSNFGSPFGTAIGHGIDPLTVKALLMNNGETNIDTDPFTGLAPITRIGGGELRVDRAVGAPVAAFSADDYTGALAFGYVEVPDTVTLTKTVTIRNLDNERHIYDVIPTFRYASDAASGAVTVDAPASVTVKPGLGRDTTFEVSITIDGALLSGNYMNSGSMGADPSGLTLNEFDGYLILDDGEHPIHLAWQVLPRKSAHVVADTMDLVPGSFPQVIGLDNLGIGTAQNDAYALLAISPDKPEGELGGQSPMPDIRAVGINTFPVPAGFCSAEASFLWAFAVNTWEPQSHLLPVSHQVSLDTDQDGTFDYVVLNRDVSFSSLSDGRQLSWVLNLATGSASAFFFAEHATNTGNTIMYICGEQVGLTGTDMLATSVDMEVFAQDWYFGGEGDLVQGLTVTPLGEQFYGVPNDVAGMIYDPAGLAVFDFGPFPGNTPELGLMLVTNGDRGGGARGGATAATEALLFTVP
jgi:subtilisin family serine protease